MVNGRVVIWNKQPNTPPAIGVDRRPWVEVTPSLPGTPATTFPLSEDTDL